MSPKGKKRPDMIGNQYAKGISHGRPPESFPDDELIEIGKEMVEWFENNELALFMQEFAIHRKIPFRKLYALAERKVFADYYESAKNICAKRIAKEAGKPNGLKEGIAQRFLACYFHDLKQTEKELKDPSAKDVAAVIQVIRQGVKDVVKEEIGLPKAKEWD